MTYNKRARHRRSGRKQAPPRPTIDGQGFIESFKEAFPSLERRRYEAYDSAYIRCIDLAEAANRAIQEGDFEFLARCFEFMDRMILEGDADVSNAVSVSFLEHLHLISRDPNNRKAKSLLTRSLREQWEDLKEAGFVN